MKKPPEGGFSSLLQRTPIKRRTGGRSGLVFAWKTSGGGGSQGLDLGRQAALVASSLVLVEDALVGDDVDDALGLGEEFGRLGLVASGDSLLNVLHGGTVFGAQRGVRGVDLDVLTDALAARREARVLLLGLGRCHVKYPLVSGAVAAKPSIIGEASCPDGGAVSSTYTRPVSLFKSASTVSLLTQASRITGLVRDVLMASVFGVSALTDAFNVAFRIPNLFRRVFGEGAFSQAFVPVLAARKAEQGEAGAKALIDHVATLLAWALVLLCIAGVVGAPLLVWAMASGLKQTPNGFDAAVVMTRWMFPYIGFMSLVALAGGVLNTWKRFAVPAASPVLLNLCLIGSIMLGAPWFKSRGIEPIYAQCVGVMVGGMLQLALQLPSLRRLGLLPSIGVTWGRLRAAWQDPTTRKVMRLMLPALLGVSVAQISLLINTQIASHLAPGSVTWVTNADRLMEFPTALLGVALGVVLMPQLAGARAAGDEARYSSMLDWGLRLVVLLSVPCALALLV